MVVLGIDPGSRRCGYGVVARDGSKLRLVESGVIRLTSALPVAERLVRIFDGLGDIITRVAAAEVAVESIFAGVSPRSALALGQARGVALAAAARAGLPVFEYAPAEVKLAFTGNGRADKAQMVRMAHALVGASARLSDEADAIALAVCHLARRPALLALAAAARRWRVQQAPRARRAQVQPEKAGPERVAEEAGSARRRAEAKLQQKNDLRGQQASGARRAQVQPEEAGPERVGGLVGQQAPPERRRGGAA